MEATNGSLATFGGSLGMSCCGAIAGRKQACYSPVTPRTGQGPVVVACANLLCAD